MSRTQVIVSRSARATEVPIGRIGPLPERKTREAEAALSKRPALETTYQRSFCHPSGKTTLPTLTRGLPQTTPVRTRDLSDSAAIAAAKRRLWQTTYQDAFCTPFPQSSIASGPIRRELDPGAIAGTTTHIASKIRALHKRAERDGTIRPTARGLTVSGKSLPETLPDGRWAPKD
jgi:hypothetical protein